MVGPRTWLCIATLLAGWGIAGAAGSLAKTASARGDETDPPTTARVAAEGVLVMRNGVVVSGRILKTGSDYEVHGPQGSRAFYPGTHVKLHAASLAEAHKKLRENALTQNSANAHVLLAQWCLTNHLDGEARQELLDALKLEPDRDDARRMLRNAEESLQKDRRIESSPVEVHDEPARTAGQTSASTEDAVSLGGLSREQALQFARRIQPLLMNNCTASGCHGRDSQNGFRLYKISPGKYANRHAAERNLAEVLECIDLKKPRSSPLLTAPRGKHGRRGRPVFAGPRGEEQLAELQKWVTAVAREESARDVDGATDRRKNSALPVSRSRTEPVPGGAPAAGDSLPAAEPFSPGAKLPSQRPLPAGSGDPFDPAAFNRSADRRPGR
jgi:hypothetical protein